MMKQTPPPEVKDIIAWLRSDRFASWSGELKEVADMIESGDPCLDGGMTPWDARHRARKRSPQDREKR